MSGEPTARGESNAREETDPIPRVCPAGRTRSRRRRGAGEPRILLKPRNRKMTRRASRSSPGAWRSTSSCTRAIEKKLPALKNKEELPEMIAAHQQALARKIREARPNAKAWRHLYTRSCREAFRHVIRSVFQDRPKLHVARHRCNSGRPAQGNVACRSTGFIPTLSPKQPSHPLCCRSFRNCRTNWRTVSWGATWCSST